MKISLILTLFLVISCSNLSKNMVSQGDMTLKGGVFQNHEWKDKLIFKRTSWYKELTMVFDALYIKIDPTSPFYDWFSNSKKTYLNSCQDFMVVATYQLDPDKISRGTFFSQLEERGYEKIALPQFKENLKMHPDFESQSFNLYKINGLCLKKGKPPITGRILVNFPGFEETAL